MEPGDAPQLERHQAALLSELGEKDRQLADMYMGAITALGRDDPEAVVQSAHSLRELLEKLPEHFDVPVEQGGPSLKVATKNLQADFERARSNSLCWADGDWSGNLDGALKRFLRRAGEFFDYLDKAKPPRQDQAKKFLQETDVGPYPLPTPIEDLRLKEWEEYRSYFLGVAHHRIPVSIDDFQGMLWRLEEFLVNQLMPRTFEDRSEISRVVAEVEGRG